MFFILLVCVLIAYEMDNLRMKTLTRGRCENILLAWRTNCYKKPLAGLVEDKFVVKDYKLCSHANFQQVKGEKSLWKFRGLKDSKCGNKICKFKNLAESGINL